jgi:hypothetical protein
MSKGFLTDQLVGVLGNVPFDVAAGTTAVGKVLTDAGLNGCRMARCYREAAALLGADYLLSGGVDLAANTKTYTTTFEIISAKDGAVVADSRARCELCGIQEVAEKVRGQVEDMARELRIRATH